MSLCPNCRAPIPAPKPGASQPLNFCQSCGKSLSVGAVKSSPAKTLMWSGGPIPGLPVKPADSAPASPPAPVPVAEAAADDGKRRTATADLGSAPIVVPPAPEEVPASRRQPQKTIIGSGLAIPIPGVVPVPAPAAGEVDVSMAEGAGNGCQGSGENVAESGAPARSVAGPQGSSPTEAGEALPEWASAAPSAGTASENAGKAKGRNKLVVAGAAGGGLLVVAVVAGLLAGGKSQPSKPQVAEAKPVAAEPAKPAAVIPEPGQAPAEVKAKTEAPAPAKAVVPAEKIGAKPSEAVMPAAGKAKVGPKSAPEMPSMAERPAKAAPIAEKPKAAAEPLPGKAEKKTSEAAGQDGEDKARLAGEAYQRGNAKLLSGALPEAIAAFSEALKLNPKDVQSQRGLGLAYAQAGNTSMAVRHLKLYVKAAPQAPDRALIEKRIEQLSGR